MKLIKTLAVASAAAMLAGSVSAATFDFDDVPVDPNDGADSLTSTSGGVTVTILGALSPIPGAVGSSFDPTAVRRTVINQNVGLGVCGENLLGTSGCTGQPLVDSGEFILFAFSKAVTVEEISFFNNDQNDFADFWYGNSLDDMRYVYSTNLIEPPDRTQTIDNSSGLFSNVLFFGVSLRPQTQPNEEVAARNGNSSNERDQFRVTGLEVTPSVIPLPAAGWLLIAGVGGLAALKRKKRAA
jgi:hypothetical protein